MRGLIRLHIQNKANLNPDPLYATYHFSHPELIERLRALGDFYDVITIEELEKKEKEVKEKEDELRAKKETKEDDKKKTE
jgi:STE24 endopeptidase